MGARRRRRVRDDRRDQGPARAVATPSGSAASSRASIKVVGVNAFTETAPSPLTASLEGESHILVLDPAAEAEQLAAARRQWRDDRDDGRGRAARSSACGTTAATDENLMAATIDAGPGRRDRRRVGRRRCATCSASTGPRPASAGSRPASPTTCSRCATQVQEQSTRARRPAADPRRQARPRRPLQRRRADRGRGPRRGHGGRLPGHPADARRRSRPRPGTRTSTSSASRSSRAPTSSSSPRRSRLLRDARRGRAGRRRRDHPGRRPGRARAAGVAGSTHPKDYRLAQIMADVADLALEHRTESRTKHSTPADRRADGLPVMDRRLALSIGAGFASLAVGVVVGVFGAPELARGERRASACSRRSPRPRSAPGPGPPRSSSTR